MLLCISVEFYVAISSYWRNRLTRLLLCAPTPCLAARSLASWTTYMILHLLKTAAWSIAEQHRDDGFFVRVRKLFISDDLPRWFFPCCSCRRILLDIQQCHDHVISRILLPTHLSNVSRQQQQQQNKYSSNTRAHRERKHPPMPKFETKVIRDFLAVLRKI